MLVLHYQFYRKDNIDALHGRSYILFYITLIYLETTSICAQVLYPYMTLASLIAIFWTTILSPLIIPSSYPWLTRICPSLWSSMPVEISHDPGLHSSKYLHKIIQCTTSRLQQGKREESAKLSSLGMTYKIIIDCLRWLLLASKPFPQIWVFLKHQREANHE